MNLQIILFTVSKLEKSKYRVLNRNKTILYRENMSYFSTAFETKK
jgi:hypothetical protein